MADWFRKTSWSTADSEEFETRLARARRASRPQFLRIQGVHLFETESRELIGVAHALASRVTSEYQKDIQTGPAHHLLGQCNAALGDFPAALHQFRLAVECEVQMPSVHTDAYLDFAWLVARQRLVEQFAEAVDLLMRFQDRPILPIQRYRHYGALAIIADARGDREVAHAAANSALHAAQDPSSPFRFHPELGLAKATPDDMHRRLERLAT